MGGKILHHFGAGLQTGLGHHSGQAELRCLAGNGLDPSEGFQPAVGAAVAGIKVLVRPGHLVEHGHLSHDLAVHGIVTCPGVHLHVRAAFNGRLADLIALGDFHRYLTVQLRHALVGRLKVGNIGKEHLSGKIAPFE